MWRNDVLVITYTDPDPIERREYIGLRANRPVTLDDVTVSQVAGMTYLPFGGYRGTEQLDPSTSNLGYTGHQHNDDLGLIYMNAQYYVPGIGRFASPDTIIPDPVSPRAFNRFTYVNNNPLRYTDPSGHVLVEGAGMGGESCRFKWDPEKCVYPEGHEDAGSAIPLPEEKANYDKNRASFLNFIGVIPYLDTGEDFTVFTTGCGYSCQAGYEDSVGWGWRGIAGVGILAPIGYRSVRTTLDGLSTARRWVGYGEDLAGYAPIRPSLLNDAVSGFKPRNFTVNGEGMHISSDAMGHILGRHHPMYWQGDVKRVNTALDADLSVDEVADLVQHTVQNGYSSRTLNRRGSYEYIGTVDGNRYKVVVGGPTDRYAPTGHVVQFTPWTQ